MGRVAGKIAIITGVASPVGGACMSLFAREGARVVATEREDAGGRSSIEALSKNEQTIHFLRHDPSSETSWQHLIKMALENHGRIDILVNAAQDFFLKPFQETSLEDLRGICGSNVVSTWLGLKYAIPAMRRNAGGYIVNVTSVLANVAHANAAAYCAAAAGVRMMTKSAALECGAGDYNILVNSVHAGAVDWPLREGSAGGAAAAKGSALAATLVDPSNVAAAALHLATPDAKYSTGAELIVDGGYIAA